MVKPSTVIAPSIQEDLLVVRAMADQIDGYFVDDEVFRTLIVDTDEGPRRLDSSLGDVLSRLYRLEAQSERLTPEQRAQLDAARRAIQDALRTMHSRFVELATREIRSRLTSLSWYLDDCQDNLRQCRVQYPFEIRNRERIEHLMEALGEDLSPEVRRSVAAVDSRIRSLTEPADFVWDERIRAIYPQERFWYLYVLPRA